MKFDPRLLLAALALLAACSSPPDRLAAPSLTPEGSVQIAFRSVEIRDVSLPTYAQGDEVMVQDQDGLIREQDGVRWADDPMRSATLDLVRGLGSLTQARIAGEPWPYNEFPDARVEVRIEEFVASLATNSFRVTGQYYIADLSNSGRDRTRRFAIDVPLPEEAGLGAFALARAEAMSQLARNIAENGLR